MIIKMLIYRIVFVSMIFSTSFVVSQNRITNWNFTLSTQEEIVLADTDYTRTYLIYRAGDASNSHTYNIFIMVDGQVLKDPNNNNVTLEEEGSTLIRGKKIVLVRNPEVYTNSHLILGNFQQIGESDDIALFDPSFSLIHGNNSPTVIMSLENTRRVRIKIRSVNSTTIKPYAIIHVDGNIYKHNGQPFQLQAGSSIELRGKYISITYPTNAPGLPSSESFLKGEYTVFNN